MESELTKKCPECKRVFYVPLVDQWAYKRLWSTSSYTYYCSWHCLRAAERKKQISKERRKQMATANTVILDKRAVLNMLILRGRTISVISEDCGHKKNWLSAMLLKNSSRIKKENAEKLANALQCDVGSLLLEVDE